MDIPLVASSDNASMLHLLQQACYMGGAAFKHTPRPIQLKVAKSINVKALVHTGTLTYANKLQNQFLQGFPIGGHTIPSSTTDNGPWVFPLEFSLFIFDYFPTLWMLPQGCVDPYVQTMDRPSLPGSYSCQHHLNVDWDLTWLP
jgi:hypothetical protein